MPAFFVVLSLQIDWEGGIKTAFPFFNIPPIFTIGDFCFFLKYLCRTAWIIILK